MKPTSAALAIVLASLAVGCGHSETPPPATPSGQESASTAPAEQASQPAPATEQPAATVSQPEPVKKEVKPVAKHTGHSKHAKAKKSAHAKHKKKAASTTTTN